MRSWSLARAVRDLRAGEIKAFQQVQYLLAFLVLEIFSWGVDTEIFQFSWNDVKTYSAPIGVGILAVKLLGPYAAYWANGGRQGSVIGQGHAPTWVGYLARARDQGLAR